MIIDNALFESLSNVLIASGQLENVVDIFVRNSEIKLSELEKAYSIDDRQKIKEVAHAFKGSCGMLGARRGADLCQTLEDAAKLDDMIIPRHILDELTLEISEFREFLEEKIDRQRTRPLQ